jgi:hypothetical protein
MGTVHQASAVLAKCPDIKPLTMLVFTFQLLTRMERFSIYRHLTCIHNCMFRGPYSAQSIT